MTPSLTQAQALSDLRKLLPTLRDTRCTKARCQYGTVQNGTMYVKSSFNYVHVDMSFTWLGRAGNLRRLAL